MQHLAVIGGAFAVIFLAELPDKTTVGLLLLGTRYQPAAVWVGAAGAFALHMGLAVTAGQLLSLLPHQAVEAAAASLFLAAAAYMWWASLRKDKDGVRADRQIVRADRSVKRAAGMGFGLVFLAEWGDITQVTAANLASRYNPWLVLAGATLGVWAAAAIVINLGTRSLTLIPATWIQRITAAILTGLGAYTIVSAVSG